MIRILAGIATVNPDRRFIESVSRLFAHQKRYHIDPLWVWDTPLVHAQNYMGIECVGGSYNYLLTLEDDHWGHTPQMLYDLVDAAVSVCAIGYPIRHYPFISSLMNWNENRGLYEPATSDEKYAEVDLACFGMTLIRADVFQLLQFPYFNLNEKNPETGATDENFCRRIKEFGVRPVGCFAHTLNHRHLTKDNINQIRGGAIVEYRR